MQKFFLKSKGLNLKTFRWSEGKPLARMAGTPGTVASWSWALFPSPQPTVPTVTMAEAELNLVLVSTDIPVCSYLCLNSELLFWNILSHRSHAYIPFSVFRVFFLGGVESESFWSSTVETPSELVSCLSSWGGKRLNFKWKDTQEIGSVRWLSR